MIFLSLLSFSKQTTYSEVNSYECTIDTLNSYLITLKLLSGNATKQIKFFIDYLKNQRDELFWSFPNIKYIANNYDDNIFSIVFEDTIPFNIQFSEVEYYHEYIRLVTILLLKHRALVKFIIRPNDHLFSVYQHIFIPYHIQFYTQTDNIIDILYTYLDELNVNFNYVVDNLIGKIKEHFILNDHENIMMFIEGLKFDFFNPFPIEDPNLFTVRYSKKKYVFLNELEFERQGGKKQSRAQNFKIMLYMENRTFLVPHFQIEFSVYNLDFINILMYRIGDNKFNYNMLSTYLYYHIKLFFIYVVNKRNNFDDFDNPLSHFYQLNNGRSLRMDYDKYVLE